MCPENCKLLLFTDLQQALIKKKVPESLAAKKLMYIWPRIVRGKMFFFPLGFVAYPSRSRVVESSCKEGAMVKHLCLENYQVAAFKFHHFTESSWKLKKWEPIAKVNPVDEIWWRPLELKTFQRWKKIWKRKGTNSNHVRYRNRHKQSQAKALVLSAFLNTWLHGCNFIYSNNTLLTARCCKSNLSASR